MKTLELIVPHYNEPFEDGQFFFDMLKLQRGCDFDDIRVTIIEDGGHWATDWVTAGLFKERYPEFEVRADRIEHAGVSAARNHGIDIADAKWVMFCDFDDGFANVYALRNIQNALKTEDFDILNGEFYTETKNVSGVLGDMTINKRRPENIYVHCRLFRLSWLREENLRFQEHMNFSEDSVFNTQANFRVKTERNGDIQCEAPLYVWRYREQSATTSDDVYKKDIKMSIERNKILLPEYMKYVGRSEYEKWVAVMFYDFFYHPARTRDFDMLFHPLYMDYISDFNRISSKRKEWIRKQIMKKYPFTKVDYEKEFSGWLKSVEKAR